MPLIFRFRCFFKKKKLPVLKNEISCYMMNFINLKFKLYKAAKIFFRDVEK